MIYLSTQTYDINGHVAIKALASSDFGEVTRRVNVVATLDGGVAVSDGGSTNADRTLVMSWLTKSRVYEANIKRLVSTYARLHLSIEDGFYVVVPTHYRQEEAESSLTLRIIEQIA